MEETAMSKKILGKKEEETKKEEEKVDYLAENCLWNVTKEGCGTSVLAGTIAASIMSVDEKRMARAEGGASLCSLLITDRTQEWHRAAPGRVQTGHWETFLYCDVGQTLEQAS